MKTLITGANGMVARATADHCRLFGDDVVAATRQDLDIADRAAVFRAVEKEQPGMIINCAAYTDVDGAETNVELCFAANAAGPENLALAAKKYGSVLVTISTDYVFDGEKQGFYTQEDAPNPQSVYAKAKLDGEMRAAAMNSNSIIVRAGWIYGENGTNFLSVIHKFLAEGKNITAISDSFGTPTYAADLAVRLRELAALRTSGIFHVSNDGPGTSYLDFARAVAGIAGFDQSSIAAVSNVSLKRPARRPANSRLACVRSGSLGLSMVRDWHEALEEFLSHSIE